MHTGFCLVEDEGLFTLEHLIRDLHLGPAEALAHLLPDPGLEIVEGGQTVEEHGLGACRVHQGLVHLIGGESRDTLCPDLHRLAHGHPDVGVQDMRAPRSLDGIGLKVQHRPGLRGNCLTFCDQRRVGEVRLRRGGDKVHPHLRAAHHQGVAHVVAGVAEVDELDPFECSEVLPDREEVGQNLGWVKLVCQAVPHRHGGVFRKLLHNGLSVAPVLDAVEHAGEDAGGVGDALLFPDLRACGIQIGHAHAEIVPRHLKGAAGPGAGLLEDQGDVLSLMQLMRDPRLLLCLELRRKIKQIGDLIRRIVKQGEKIASV